ncbi:Stp1/IreP family PP2C-type Ser/Thr phosphatase [Pueribacillus sp. YX66]|uniref:Stp1/IreP family PP2C-type Ser/Thr phosphatase n=1 Tax=Pueribacillus sp. YX66 TaxID=3229242 RepID=UPI00358D13A9
MAAVFRTDTGKIRTLNEDYGGFFWNGNRLLAVVADGMGGHQAGEIASEMAVSFLEEEWQKVTNDLTPSEAEQWLNNTITEANTKLFNFSKSNPEYSGMGTTIVAVICTDSNVTFAHIGDSRIYLLNESGFSLLTEDHSLVNELVKNGQITKEEAEHHPRKHILLRALGTEENVTIDIRSLDWEENDYLLLCSDGLTNKVDERELEQTIRSSESLEKQADELIAMANAAGGEDNITLILLKHVAFGKKGESS